MAKTTRFFLRVLIVVSLCVATHPSVAARSHRARPTVNNKYAALVMDAQTGRVLEEENADKVLFPASLTKMMTLFLTFEALENGQLHMNKYLDVSANAVRQPPSKLGVRVGDNITVQQAIQAIVTRSANDIAVVLAENIGGSEKNFTRMMTQRAHSLGMRNSNFVNPSGLPSPYQRSSARDMATLARALMQYFPQYYHFFNLRSFTYKGQVITTHNHLMERFAGMDGLKTGYTYASGFNLVASAVRNNRRVIVAVFGGRTANSRDSQVAELMNRGLATLSRQQMQVQVAAATTPAVTTAQTQVTTIQEVVNNESKSVQVASAGADWVADGGQVKTLTAQPVQSDAQKMASVAPSAPVANNWGIQVGAFGDQALAQATLNMVRQQLGSVLAGAQQLIVPVRTANGVVYRARLTGLNADNAALACARLTDCLAFTLK